MSFSLAAFKILSLSLILGDVIMMCLNYTTPLLYEVLRGLSKKKKKITNINSKMTTKSQLSTTEPKNKTKQKQTKQTTRTGTEPQKWRSQGGLSVGSGRGRMREKVQGIISINGR